MEAAGLHLLRLGPALWKFALRLCLRANPQAAMASVSTAAGARPGFWTCVGFDWKEDFEAEEAGKPLPPVKPIDPILPIDPIYPSRFALFA